MVDRDDDLKIGISESTAILFGRFDKLIVGFLQLVTLAMLIALGIRTSWVIPSVGHCWWQVACCVSTTFDASS